MNLRPASLDDLELLKFWDSKQHIIDTIGEDVWDWDKELAEQVDWRLQFIAEDQGQAIGFLQILDPYRDEEEYWGEVPDNLRAIDIWIGDENNIGIGYGTKMMTMAIEHCFSDNTVEAILLDPFANNTKAHAFYEKLGFRFVEKRQFDDAKCCVYRLDRQDWHEHG